MACILRVILFIAVTSSIIGQADTTHVVACDSEGGCETVTDLSQLPSDEEYSLYTAVVEEGGDVIPAPFPKGLFQGWGNAIKKLPPVQAVPKAMNRLENDLKGLMPKSLPYYPPTQPIPNTRFQSPPRW